MKLWAYGAVAACLILASGSVKADSPSNSNRNSSHKQSREITHAGNGVGHGLSRMYHEAAKGVNKTIAKNTHDPHRRAVHMRKAHAHRSHARKEAGLAHREFKRADQ